MSYYVDRILLHSQKFLFLFGAKDQVTRFHYFMAVTCLVITFKVYATWNLGNDNVIGHVYWLTTYIVITDHVDLMSLAGGSMILQVSLINIISLYYSKYKPKDAVFVIKHIRACLYEMPEYKRKLVYSMSRATSTACLILSSIHSAY